MQNSADFPFELYHKLASHTITKRLQFYYKAVTFLEGARRTDSPRRGGEAWGGGVSRRQPHSAKPNAARRASVSAALFVGKAAFVVVRKGSGKLKAAVCGESMHGGFLNVCNISAFGKTPQG